MIAVIDYNAGNTRSVINALERLDVEAVVTANHDEIFRADRVIFPGVGEASSAMKSIRDRGLDRLIPKLEQPFLGICLGMQLMCQRSEENDTECLGIIPNRVLRFQRPRKIPHMGWNEVSDLRGPLWAGIKPETDFYFVHSYYVELSTHTTATCTYEERFSATIQHENFYGVQFHTEKSSVAGQQLLQNFLNL